MTSIITLSIFSQTWALHKREIGTFFDCNSCETASAILKHFDAESVKTASIFSQSCVGVATSEATVCL